MDVFYSGMWRTVTRGEVLIAGAWRRILRAEVYREGAWRPCLRLTEQLTVSVVPASVFGTVTPSRPMRQTVTTETAQATPSGGLAPYSYSWAASEVTPTTPASAATAFSASLASEERREGTATVTCTDALGNTAIGAVNYYLYNQSNQ